jgi:hypothetical protein
MVKSIIFQTFFIFFSFAISNGLIVERFLNTGPQTKQCDWLKSMGYTGLQTKINANRV